MGGVSDRSWQCKERQSASGRMHDASRSPVIASIVFSRCFSSRPVVLVWFARCPSGPGSADSFQSTRNRFSSLAHDRLQKASVQKQTTTMKKIRTKVAHKSALVKPPASTSRSNCGLDVDSTDALRSLGTDHRPVHWYVPGERHNTGLSRRMHRCERDSGIIGGGDRGGGGATEALELKGEWEGVCMTWLGVSRVGSGSELWSRLRSRVEAGLSWLIDAVSMWGTELGRGGARLRRPWTQRQREAKAGGAERRRRSRRPQGKPAAVLGPADQSQLCGAWRI